MTDDFKDLKNQAVNIKNVPVKMHPDYDKDESEDFEDIESGIARKEMELAASQRKKEQYDIKLFTTVLKFEHPVFTKVLNAVTILRSNTTPTACVGIEHGKAIMFYGTKFFAKLTNKQTLGLIMHEMLHLLFGHVTMRQRQPHKIWNIACDLAINSVIPRNWLPREGMFPGERPMMEEKDGSIKPDNTWWGDLMTGFESGKSADYYFDKIQKAMLEHDAICDCCGKKIRPENREDIRQFKKDELTQQKLADELKTVRKEQDDDDNDISDPFAHLDEVRSILRQLIESMIDDEDPSSKKSTLPIIKSDDEWCTCQHGGEGKGEDEGQGQDQEQGGCTGKCKHKKGKDKSNITMRGRSLNDIPDPIDNHETWKENPEGNAVIDQIKEDVGRDMDERERNRTFGGSTADMLAILRQVIQKTVDWRQFFRNFVKRSIQSNKRESYKTRDRRHPKFPGIVKGQLPKILVAIDESGSMGDPELEEIFAELTILANTVEFTILVFDAQTATPTKWKKGAKMPMGWKSIKREKRGGTSFDNVMKFTNDTREGRTFDAVIICTDGQELKPREPRRGLSRGWLIVPGQHLMFEASKGDTVIEMTYTKNSAKIRSRQKVPAAGTVPVGGAG